MKNNIIIAILTALVFFVAVHHLALLDMQKKMNGNTIEVVGTYGGAGYRAATGIGVSVFLDSTTSSDSNTIVEVDSVYHRITSKWSDATDAKMIPPDIDTVYLFEDTFYLFKKHGLKHQIDTHPSPYRYQ